MDSGQIFFNVKDVKEYDVQNLRREIGHVGQESILFSGSILDNITYGFYRGAATSDTPSELKALAIEAAKTAHAYEFIMSFEDGFDTLCGERGISLSGGQRQRISIARAILRKPSLLLLDEATSALDSESEKIVQKALDAISDCGITTIVVAHRLRTVRNADMSVVMSGGKVIERGSHDELMGTEMGAYKKLVFT